MTTVKLAIWAIGTLLSEAGVLSSPELFKPIKTEPNPAIVEVFVPGAKGTGFFIDVNGLKVLITAAHVCADSRILVSAKGLHKVLAIRPEKDICIASTYQNVATLELGEDAKPGDAVVMNGFPGNLQYDVQVGTAEDVGVSSFAFPPNYYNEGCPNYSLPDPQQNICAVFVTTTTLNILARGGNSGGPIQDATTGKVVGLIIGGDREGKYGVATPVSELMGMLEGRP